MNKAQLAFIARAIRALDNTKWVVPKNSKDDIRITKARNCLINIVFEAGYELQQDTYRVIKSKIKRELAVE